MTPDYVKRICSLPRGDFESVCRAAASGPTSSWARILGEGGPLLKTAAGDPEIAPFLLRDGFWEPWVTMALGRTDLLGGTAWNIGANQGYYTSILRMMVGETGRVLSFEPQPKLLQCVRFTADENDWTNIVTVPHVVGREPGQVPFYVNMEAPGQSSALPVRHGEVLQANSTTLDLARSADGPPDLIFCDAEGSEEDIFLGSRSIAECRPTIFLEFFPARYRTPRTLLSFFDELGYSVGRVMFDGSVRPFDAKACIDRGTWTVLVLTPDGDKRHVQSSDSPPVHEEGLWYRSESTVRRGPIRASVP